MSTFTLTVILSIASFAILVHGRAIDLGINTGVTERGDTGGNIQDASQQQDPPNLWRQHQALWITLIIVGPPLLCFLLGAIFVFGAAILFELRQRRGVNATSHQGNDHHTHTSRQEHREYGPAFGADPTYPAACYVPDSSGGMFGGGSGGDGGGGGGYGGGSYGGGGDGGGGGGC